LTTILFYKEKIMKNILKGSLVIYLITIGGSLAFADSVNDSNLNVAFKAGTLGAGIDLSKPISNDFSLRLNVNGFTYNDNIDVDNINYDGDLKLLSAGVLIDYFPFESTFRISGGAYYNGNTFDGYATPTALEDITIGDNTYTVNEVARLNTNVEFNKMAPYLGIGWGNDISEKDWGLTLDLGVMYHGEPKVDLSVKVDPSIQGTLLEDEINTNVIKESQQFLEDVKDFKFYPVVMIGLNYKF